VHEAGEISPEEPAGRAKTPESKTPTCFTRRKADLPVATSCESLGPLIEQDR
jgi:hypothetical protein